MRTTKLNPVLAPFARAVRTALLASVVASPGVALCWQSAGAAQTAATVGPSEFKIGGAVGTPLTISQADLKSGPRVTVPVVNSHSNKTETYQGVPLSALLQKAGVPQGEKFRGRG